MDTDDLAPAPSKEWKPTPLDGHSIDALNAYKERLAAEIERVDAAIEAKRAQRGAAEALFKT